MAVQRLLGIYLYTATTGTKARNSEGIAVDWLLHLYLYTLRRNAAGPHVRESVEPRAVGEYLSYYVNTYIPSG